MLFCSRVELLAHADGGDKGFLDPTVESGSQLLERLCRYS